jgi:hypothetical protein
MLGVEENDDSRILASLAFVNCNGVGVDQLIQGVSGIFDDLRVEIDGDRSGGGIDGFDKADVAVENIFFVIVPDLD